MDPALLTFLGSASLPVIYAGAIIWLAKTLLKKMEDQQAQLVALIDRYHTFSIDVTKQLTIIAEELRKG